MATEFQYKKNTKVVVDLDIGERVMVKGFSKVVDGEYTIEGFEPRFSYCESGIMVQLKGVKYMLDSGWITKLPQEKETINH